MNNLRTKKKVSIAFRDPVEANHRKCIINLII